MIHGKNYTVILLLLYTLAFIPAGWFQVSRRWNDVISSNDLLWKQICSQHGFVTARSTSVVPSPIVLTEPCSDCKIVPSSEQLVTESRASSSQSTASFLPPFANDDNSCDLQSQPSFKEVFLSRRRIFHSFSSGQSVNNCVISGYTNRIMAIDYHNGYVATGMCSHFFLA